MASVTYTHLMPILRATTHLDESPMFSNLSRANLRLWLRGDIYVDAPAPTSLSPTTSQPCL